ncbi:MAG: glycosyltransferase family 2 protein [Thermoleophilaceae bacterium]
MELAGSAPARASETGQTRPAVDVVVPFHGTANELAELRERLAGLRLRDGDSLTVVDNRADAASARFGERRRVLGAPALQSSYFARNAGAAGGRAAWLLFLDADTEPPAGLIDSYFTAPPGPHTAVLAGGVRDVPLHRSARPTLAERYASICSLMSQQNTLRGERGYAQTANCAVLREAFEEAGGFEPAVRSGGDADLCFRLRERGWEIEPREAAAVLHHSRSTLRGFLRQRARYGAGAAWLAERHPGSFEAVPLRNLMVWTAKCALRGLRALARGRRDEAIVCLFDPAGMWALELGRRRGSNAA